MGQLLIDDELVFDENNFLLFRLGAANEEPVRLGAIASRCLAMLLRSEGAVVGKRELIAATWGQYGLEVTDNSLVQIVRQLRMALEKLKPGRTYIQTLPRLGYKLAEGVKVEPLTAPLNRVPSPLSTVTGSEAPAPDVPDASLIAETETETETETDLAESAAITAIPTTAAPASGPPPTHPITAPRRWLLWLALPLCGACAFVLASIWPTPSLEVEPPAFAASVTIDEVQVHLPIQDIHPPVAAHLQLMVQKSRKLAGFLGLSAQNIHLYLLPSRRGADQILCDGALESASSRCIGVQQHD